MMLFKYPTTKIIIDDDKTQLKALEAAFKEKLKLGKYYSDIPQTIKLINSITPVERHNRERALKYISLEPQAISKFVMYKKYNEISVVMADYMIGGNITGLDLLKNIKDENTFKILFTGVADENIAVTAFNNRIIDGYFKKSDKLEHLLSVIQSGEMEFFKRKSKFLEHCIGGLNKNRYIFNNVQFAKIFDEIVKSKHIEEFYLLDEQGSYLMFSRKNIYTLLVMHFESISAQVEIIKENNMRLPIKEIEEKKKMIYLGHNIDIRKSIFSVHGISTKYKFMYTLVQGNPLNINLKNKPIF